MFVNVNIPFPPKKEIRGHEFCVRGFTTVTPPLLKTIIIIIIAGESLLDLRALVFTSTCE